MSKGRMVRATLAGQMDSGLASLATFASGVFASRNLSPLEMGGYTLIFVAFVAATHVSTQLLFIPFEVDSIRSPALGRAGVLRSSLLTGGVLSLLAALIAGLGAIPVWGDVDRSVLGALAVTGVAAAFLSPIQDHIRRLFHILGRSSAAATMSTVQVATTIILLLVIGANFGSGWAPFGALAIANVVSIAIGLSLYPWTESGYSPPTMGTLFGTGKWLLVAGMSEPILAYGALAVVSALAGLDAVGYAESARIVARPLTVVGLGLAAVFGPRAVEAADRSDLVGAMRVRRRIWMVVIGVGIPYLIVVGLPWGWSPILSLVPNAYEVGGLVLVACFAALVLALTIPFYSELLGWRAERSLARISVSAGLIQVGASPISGMIGAFAVPTAAAMGAGTFAVLATRKLRHLYGSGPVES